jgi:Glycosyl hydrolase family 76
LSRARLAVPLAVAILLCAAQAAAASPAHGGASQYPAGAERPAIAATATGGAQQGGSSPTATGSNPTPLKPTSKAKTTLRGNPARALLAFKTMQRYFYLQGTGLYKGEPYSFLWPFSQALAATVSLAHIPGEASALAHELRVRMFGLERYWEASSHPSPEQSGEQSTEQSTIASVAPLPSFAGTVAPPLGAGGTSYYDDNEWVGIELARLYELNHEAFALQQARQIMAFVMAGWQTTTPSGRPLACPGGVPFSNSPTNNSRNTVTDGPAAELGAQLYRITGEPQYLAFARMAYGWVRQCLLAPNGLYADHMMNNGEVEPMQWSYNQGTMMGAGALLYQATGEAAYLYQARQTAKAALAYYTTEKLELENPFFASVYLRNLLYLDSISHDPPGPRLVQSYVNYSWANLRLSNYLFVSGSPSTSTLLGQAAIVQLYALLSTPPATYF